MAEVDVDALFREVFAGEPPQWSGPYPLATRDYVVGEVWSRPGLSLRDRRLVSLACVASYGVTTAMETHVHGAFTSGDIGLDEMLECVLHFAVYNGWARASFFEGIVRMQWVRVCRERGEDVGAWPEAPDADVDLDDPRALRAQGARTYREVLGVEPPEHRSPFHDTGVLGFSYARVWGRPTLARRDRRLLTLPWVAINGSASTARRHVDGALLAGDLDAEELHEVVLQTSAYAGVLVGERLADAAQAALAEPR